MIAIPSTLSGGEYNSGALVTDTRRKLKQNLQHPMMMPRTIILDPAITRLHPGKTVAGVGHPRHGSRHRGDLLDPQQPAGRQRLSARPALSP